MQIQAGQLALVTGAGSGIGRELARQLAAAGVHLALCDLDETGLAETRAQSLADAPAGTRVTTRRVDVTREDQLIALRDAVRAEHGSGQLHLLFNNAGIGGGGSFVDGDRTEWERTFAVCWQGVYLGCRTFLPMLIASPEAFLVNVSSVNGFWASLGPNVSHTSYAAAKFAVKGFTEAMVTDLRLTAPHIKCSVVMPGHIGTEIAANSRKVINHSDDDTLSETELARARARMARAGVDTTNIPDAMIQQMVTAQARAFHDNAPMSAAQAATIILDGVKAERWRILVGEDAIIMDRMVRETPEEAYEQSFYERMTKAVGWQLGNMGGAKRE